MIESIFEPDAPNAPAPAPAAPQPPPLAHSLSSQLTAGGQLNEDAIEELLRKADVPMICKLKSVSRSWRARARRVLWARLCRREGQPVPTSRAGVTDIDLEPCLQAIGPGVRHVIAAMAQFPNLARMHAHGFVVDVAAVRGLGPAPEFVAEEETHVLQPVRGCIGGGGEPPGGLLLAVRAARYGEARVPEGAFRNCSSLTALTVPAGFTEIGGSAFADCSSLTTLTLPAGLAEIGGGAFDGCRSLTTLILPASLTTLGGYAFHRCSSLTTLTLPAGLTEIGGWTFYGCSSLTTLTLPASLTRIGWHAFQGCSSLTTLTLPAGLIAIGQYAFHTCSSLTALTLPAGLEIGYHAFRWCSSLTTLTVVSDHAEPRVLSLGRRYSGLGSDTNAVEQALEQARRAAWPAQAPAAAASTSARRRPGRRVHVNAA